MDAKLKIDKETYDFIKTHKINAKVETKITIDDLEMPCVYANEAIMHDLIVICYKNKIDVMCVIRDINFIEKIKKNNIIYVDINGKIVKHYPSYSVKTDALIDYWYIDDLCLIEY